MSDYYVCSILRDLDDADSNRLNVQVDPKDIERLLTSSAFCLTFRRVSAHGLALPLKFASPLAELNLISILALLNFASAYRVPLHVANGRGARDTIRAFVFALYIASSTDGEGDHMSARGMRGDCVTSSGWAARSK